MSTFAGNLKSLFGQAYPSENPTSGTLLQRFLTGLQPLSSCQLLLWGNYLFRQAVKDAGEIEYALSFETNKIFPKKYPIEIEKLQET